MEDTLSGDTEVMEDSFVPAIYLKNGVSKIKNHPGLAFSFLPFDISVNFSWGLGRRGGGLGWRQTILAANPLPRPRWGGGGGKSRGLEAGGVPGRGTEVLSKPPFPTPCPFWSYDPPRGTLQYISIL